ncbi:prepilin-type N-terminal cleavage/methylation domain-containing protein [Opitutaceae bacterium TAV1]|nr:prepilin-type N-terminal cleavage/methylation domain-containing protein [Opitutaceae bacterium TAV1]
MKSKTNYACAVRGGFTLIELLTVIAIIGILAAIIIPTVSKVRKTAQSTRCSAGLRSAGAAIQLFTNDNRGRLPIADNGVSKNGHWFVQVAPYLGAQYAADATVAQMEGTRINKPVGCPLAPQFEKSYDVKGIGVSYGWNGVKVTLRVPKLAEGIDVTQITTPSRTIMLGERWGQTGSGGRDWGWRCAPPWDGTDPMVDADKDTSAGKPDSLRLSHGGRANFLFFDGHVASMKPEDTYTAGGDPDGDSANPNLWKGF